MVTERYWRRATAANEVLKPDNSEAVAQIKDLHEANRLAERGPTYTSGAVENIAPWDRVANKVRAVVDNPEALAILARNGITPGHYRVTLVRPRTASEDNTGFTEGRPVVVTANDLAKVVSEIESRAKQVNIQDYWGQRRERLEYRSVAVERSGMRQRM